MKILLLMLLLAGSIKSFSQYDRNMRLIDSIENTISDTAKPLIFSLNVIDSNLIKRYFFHERTNEIQGVDFMDTRSGKRVLIFYTPEGFARKIMLWLPDEKWGQLTTQYYFKGEKIFYINGPVLNNEDLESTVKLAKEQYETAKVVFQNKEQVIKNFKAWREKTYTNNPDFKESKKD